MLYDFVRMSFLCKLIQSGVMQRYNLVDKRDFAEFEHLNKKYGIQATDSKSIIKKKVWNEFINVAIV